jgi:NADPH2:quinone reductase
MPSMQAATYKSFGVPSNVLSIETTDIPEPQAGEVRVKLLLSPIHNHDLYLIRGQYGYKSPLPAIGGSEAVGTIDKLGAGVSGLHIGQRLAVSSTPIGLGRLLCRQDASRHAGAE